MNGLTRGLCVVLCATGLTAQVYSPSVLLEGQPDSTDLSKFAQSIYRKAGATTPETRARAIWQFFLTDGRFVEPGFWYHIAGWAYEEPTGEVLDPIKLLNSYGFGLCYHIAPLLEAVFEAGGFKDARVWFLTGHTVAEVYYDGAYHYYDSDMMGYTVSDKRVISVRDVERHPKIVTDKMAGPRKVREEAVNHPWYPADVRAGAIDGLVSLFTTAKDNYVFPFTRYSRGHGMDFVLRPGEKVIRYAEPETPDLFYLPYAFDGKEWREFPTEIPRYQIRTANGPRSQKDARLWGTGRIEYTPPAIAAEPVVIIDMPSPWVIIDAKFTLSAELLSATSSILVETSVDGKHWDVAGDLQGPHTGEWTVEPKVTTRSANGRLTAVSGNYGYKVRITRPDPAKATIESARLVTRFQHNPRTLPLLSRGQNDIVYRSGAPIVREPVVTGTGNFQKLTEKGQTMLLPPDSGGELIVEVSASGEGLAGFDAGARFIHIQGGLAPDKLTAETRATRTTTQTGTASLDWSLSRSGPWQTLWSWPAQPLWLDEDPIDRTLLWPEAFQQIRNLPSGTRTAFVRIRSTGPAVDSIRISALAHGDAPSGKLAIIHRWTEDAKQAEHREIVDAAAPERRYKIAVGSAATRQSVTLELLR